MSKQAENFKNLVKGNDVNSIIRALKMIKASVYNELMEEYKCSSVEALAFKLR